MKFPTYEEMGHKVAEIAMNEYMYEGKSLIEWAQIILENQDEDCISRKEVLRLIEESVAKYCGQYSTDMLNMWGLFSQMITELPSVLPKPKEGHWIYGEDNYGADGYYCSQCGSHYPIRWGVNESFEFITDYNYCPNCGCRMVEPQESEDKE